MTMWNKPDPGKTVVFEYHVHCPTPQSLPSLPACLTTPYLPDFTQHTGLEEEVQPLLSRTSTVRALFSKTMQQRHLFQASNRKLQDDMKDNMRRYKSEKAKLQEQLASLRSQLEDYHLDTGCSHGTSDKTAGQLDMASHQKHSRYYIQPKFAHAKKWKAGQGRYLMPKGRLALQSLSDCSSNRKSSYKPFLTERPHYLPQLDRAVVSRAAKNLEWYSGYNLGGTTSKLPPLSKNLSVQRPTIKGSKSPESGAGSGNPDTLATVSTPDIMTCDSRQDLDTMSFKPEASKLAKGIDDVTRAKAAPVMMVPKLSLPSEPYSSPRSGHSPDGITKESPQALYLHAELQVIRPPPPALGADKRKTTPRSQPSGLLSMPLSSKKIKKIPNSQHLHTKANPSDGLNVLIATASTKRVNPPVKPADGSCDPLKPPSITLRPASKTGELERLKSILSIGNQSPSGNNKGDRKQKDPSMRWKAMYLKIMDPQKRSQMLADIVFAVRAKMRENEHQLKFGENPEDPITHNTLCDFLLYKPQKHTINKTKKHNPRAMPHHTAVRSSRKSHAAQLQEYLRNSLRNRPMIEHLEAEEYRLMRYGKHRYLLQDIKE